MTVADVLKLRGNKGQLGWASTLHISSQKASPLNQALQVRPLMHNQSIADELPPHFHVKNIFLAQILTKLEHF